MNFKNKKISVLIITALFLTSIGGVMAQDHKPFENESHASSCHETDGNLGEGPTFESENGSIYKDSTFTEPGIYVNSTVVGPNTDILVAIWIYNFTEAVSDLRRDPLGNGSVTVQFSPDRGNNDKFYVLKGILNNDDGKADANGYWHTNDKPDLTNNTGNSLTSINFTVRSPNITVWGGYYFLIIDVIDALNATAGHSTIAVIYATASIVITVLPLAPPSSGGGSGGDRDLYKEDTIPGNLLIITFFSIFAVSTILIIKRKKQLKRKT